MKCLMWLLLLAAVPVSAQEGSVAVSPLPKTFQVVGNTDALYPPTRWPIFVNSQSDNNACHDKLETLCSGRRKDDATNSPLCHPECFNKFKPVSIISTTVDFDKEMGRTFSKTAKMVVTWTVRMEAYKENINPWWPWGDKPDNAAWGTIKWPGTILPICAYPSKSPVNGDVRPKQLCGDGFVQHLALVGRTWTDSAGAGRMWHGDSQQNFPGGDARTWLYLNGKQVGRVAEMTFPSLGSGANLNISDPTITGSVTVSAADFGGEFPNRFNLDVMWENDTVGAMIKSPAGMRNMTVLLMPVGQ